MSPDLYTRKLYFGFDHLDVDGSGDLDEDDYVAMARRVSDALGHPVDSPAEQRIRERYLDVWHQAFLPMVPDGATALPREGYAAGIRELAESDPSPAEPVLRGVVGVFMETADVDTDGVLSLEEFRTWLRSNFPAVTEAEGEVSFLRLDTDSDGALSAEEVLRAVMDFTFSSDPDVPGNWLFGRLPD